MATNPKAEEPAAAAKPGDTLTIDFKGMIGGKAFAGGAGTDHDLTLGSGQFIPGFEEQLVGAAPGDERQVKVTFPKDYHSAPLAGKEAVFIVNVKAIRRDMATDAIAQPQLSPEDALMLNMSTIAGSQERLAALQSELKTAAGNEGAARQDFERANNHAGWRRELGLGMGVGAAMGLTHRMSLLPRIALGVLGGAAGYFLGHRVSQGETGRTAAAYAKATQHMNVIKDSIATELVMDDVSSRGLMYQVDALRQPSPGFAEKIGRSPAPRDDNTHSFTAALNEETANPTPKIR